MPAEPGQSSMKVLFVARGSARDGLGHVIRSRTVARAMQAWATVRMVVIGDRYVEPLLSGRDLDWVVVEQETRVLAVYQAYRPDLLVFDLVAFDVSLFVRLAAACPTVSLSPIFNCLESVDLVFHRSRVHGAGWPAGDGKPLIRSGLQYSVVGDHCHRISDEAYAQNLRFEELAVAISMGGTDAANKTMQVLRIMKQVTCRLLIWVMLGEGYTHSYQDLVDCMRNSGHEIVLAKSNDSAWRILSTCSLAILAGGVTTYEAAYAGLPSINILETEDRFFLIKELVECGVCLYAGHVLANALEQVNATLRDVYLDRRRLLEMHMKSSGLIDGLGAQRIAREILQVAVQEPVGSSGSR